MCRPASFQPDAPLGRRDMLSRCGQLRRYPQVPQQSATRKVSHLRAALLARCPRCGKDPLFKNVLELREGCAGCGLNYGFIDTGDGPAVFAIFILGFLVLGMALYVEFTYE